MGSLPSVLLVHPDPAYRGRVHRLLVRSGFRVAGEAATAASGLVMVRRSPSDLLVVSQCVGDLEEMVRYASDQAGLRVLLLTMGVDYDLAVDLVNAGATGVVCSCRLVTLPTALRVLLSGDVAVPRDQMAGLMAETRRRLAVQDLHSPWTGLSERQREVMELVRRGLRTDEIAADLGVEAVTVRTHVAAVLHKLDVHTRAEALRVLDGGRGGRDSSCGGRAARPRSAV